MTRRKALDHGGEHRKSRAARPVADLVSKLLDPVIERRAGMTMDLIAAWPEIAGDRHAALTRPEKLNWPRRAHEDDPFHPATLVVACESAHALFFQHECDVIIARINTYFGFAAVDRVKLSQKPVETATLRPEKKSASGNLATITPSKREHLTELLSSVEDDTLKDALEKLGQGVFRRSSSQSN